MDIGISTLVDLDVPLTELLPMIAAAGFSHFDLSHDIQHAGYHRPQRRQSLRRLMDKQGLRLNYIHAPLEIYYDLTSPDGQVRRLTIEAIKLAINACAELGGSYIVVHAMYGSLEEQESVEQRVQQGLNSLRELADYCTQQQVSLCLENLPVDGDYGRVTYELFHAANWPDLFVCLDTCHVWINNDDPMYAVRNLAPRVRTTHFSDTMGALDSHLIPYEGVVDFNSVARELAKANFQGVLSLECSLWMLRKRVASGKDHPGDPVPCSTEHYLERAAAAAQRIADAIEDARNS